MASRRECLRAAAITLGCGLIGKFGLLQQLNAVQHDKLPPLKRLKNPRVTDLSAKVAADRLRPLHDSKVPAEPGDWLAEHEETGQSYAEFLSTRSERHCERFKKQYVQPLGEFDKTSETMLPHVKEMLEACFGFSVVLRKSLALNNVPDWAKRGSETDLQYATPYVMDKVLKVRPQDAVAVLGLLTTDLYPDEKWNFVFGIASLDQRIGIWSTARLGNPEGSDEKQKQFLRRTLKVAVHETGHMFGIRHCTAYECGMNGSNSLSESDRQLFEFCPECQAKIWWTCDYPPVERLKRMAAVCKKLDWAEEQSYYERALTSLNSPDK